MALCRQAKNTVRIGGRHRLHLGKRHAFEASDHITIVGPACGYGADYLRHLWAEGRYAESLEEASQLARSRGATVTGIWFVKS